MIEFHHKPQKNQINNSYNLSPNHVQIWWPLKVVVSRLFIKGHCNKSTPLPENLESVGIFFFADFILNLFFSSWRVCLLNSTSQLQTKQTARLKRGNVKLVNFLSIVSVLHYSEDQIRYNVILNTVTEAGNGCFI